MTDSSNSKSKRCFDCACILSPSEQRRPTRRLLITRKVRVDEVVKAVFCYRDIYITTCTKCTNTSPPPEYSVTCYTMQKGSN